MDPRAAGRERGTLPTPGCPREQWALSKTSATRSGAAPPRPSCARLCLGFKKGLIRASSEQGVKRARSSHGTGMGLSPVIPQNGVLPCGVSAKGQEGPREHPWGRGRTLGRLADTGPCGGVWWGPIHGARSRLCLPDPALLTARRVPSPTPRPRAPVGWGSEPSS